MSVIICIAECGGDVHGRCDVGLGVQGIICVDGEGGEGQVIVGVSFGGKAMVG